jgi:hypothetical protein
MFKLHFKKVMKRNAYNHTIDFKKIVQEKLVPFHENTCSLGKLDGKPNHTKFSKS